MVVVVFEVAMVGIVLAVAMVGIVLAVAMVEVLLVVAMVEEPSQPENKFGQKEVEYLYDIVARMTIL